jgi:hypothetical protein
MMIGTVNCPYSKSCIGSTFWQIRALSFQVRALVEVIFLARLPSFVLARTGHRSKL